jgi:hypothetical protein
MTGSGALLEWITSSELSSDYFEVQRLYDENYVSLGRVNAVGDSHGENQYSFLDEYPAYGDNYYRLRQVDTDGSFEYSYVITVRNEINPTTLRIRVHPNPADRSEGEINVEVNTPSNELPVLIKAVDLLGRDIATRSYLLRSNHEPVEFPISEFKPGFYILIAEQGRLRHGVRLIIE